MAITAAVTPGETYPDSTNVTRAMLRNGAAPAIAISGDIENADVADAAAIAFSKLETLANGSIVVGNSSNVATECTITTGSMAVSGDAVTITPSNETITKSKLDKSDANNLIAGQDSAASLAADDSLLIYDLSASSGDRLKKTTVGALTNSGDVTTIEGGGGVTAIDLDVGNPVNTFAIGAATTLTPIGYPTSGYKTCVLHITNGTAGNLVLTLAEGAGSKTWAVLKNSSATPALTIVAGGSAILSVMAFSGSQVGAFASTA
tara:strand:- start:890 stop:1675 length:786 start_codon:yes stop_codon:yes gene_type:complete